MQPINFKSPRKLSHFTILVSLAKSDGNISPEEFQFLKMYGELAGLSGERVLDLIENPGTNNLLQLKLVSPLEREKFIFDLIVLALSDDVISAEECRKIYDIAASINMHAVTVDRCFKVLSANLPKVKEVLRESLNQYA